MTNKITRTIPDILAHLFNAYGHVTPTELYELKQKVETMQFNPQEPVDTLITEIDDLADIADLAGSPISDRQRVDLGYIILQQCKPFKTALREWNTLSVAGRTYNAFKTHFRDAQIALRKTGEITVAEGLNHAAVVDMVTEGVRAAFADHDVQEENIANSETEDLRKEVQTMRELVQKLNITQQTQAYQNPPQPTAQIPFSQEQHMQQPFMFQPSMFPQGYYQFPNHSQYNNYYNRGGRGGRGGRGRGGRGGRNSTRERRYCWTHGLAGHNRKECKNPMQGHQPDATLENKMGGSTRNCNA